MQFTFALIALLSGLALASPIAQGGIERDLAADPLEARVRIQGTPLGVVDEIIEIFVDTTRNSHVG